MPLFGDQHDNLARAVRRGFAVSLDQNQVQNAQALEAAFEKALSTEFHENAQRTQTAIRSHATPALDKVAAWVEYGIATKGAQHRIPLWISEQSSYFDVSLPHVLLWGGILVLLSSLVLVLYCSLAWGVKRILRTKNPGKIKATEKSETASLFVKDQEPLSKEKRG